MRGFLEQRFKRAACQFVDTAARCRASKRDIKKRNLGLPSSYAHLVSRWVSMNWNEGNQRSAGDL